MARSSGGDRITQRLSLEGSDEIRRQLRELGAEGEKAALQMEAAIGGANVGLSTFSQKIETARGHLQTAATHWGTLNTHIGKMGQNLSSLVPQLSATVAGLLSLGAAVGAFNLAKNAALATDELKDTAENAHITTEELLALREVAAATGTDFDVLTRGINKVDTVIGDTLMKQKGYNLELSNQATLLKGNTDAVNAYSAEVQTLRGNQKGLKDDVSATTNVLRGAGAQLDAMAPPVEIVAKLLGLTVKQFEQLQPIPRLMAINKALNLLKDETVQNTISTAFFNKGWKDMRPVLKDLEEKFDGIHKKIKASGQGVSALEDSMSKGFLSAFAAAGTDVNAVFRTLGNQLGRVFVPVMVELDRWLSNNNDQIKIWAASIGNQLLPMVRDLIALWRGATAEQLETDQIRDLIPLFDAVAAGARLAFGIIVGGFQLVAAILSPVAAVINSVLGTNLTGTTLAVAAAILYLVGAFNALLLVFNLVAAAAAAFQLAFAGIAAVIALIGLPLFILGLIAVIAYFTDWDVAFRNLYDTAAAFWKMMEAVGQVVLESIGAWFTTNLVDPWNVAIYWANYYWGLLRGILSDIGKVIGLSAGGGLSLTPFAAGGAVHGPGTGTSDSILARLSTGEWVNTARAVRYWGAGVFHALNNFRNPFIAGFADGGLVGNPASGLMAAASGIEGAVSVDLTDNGNTFRGLLAPAGVAGALVRYSHTKRVRSTGRKPSWRS